MTTQTDSAKRFLALHVKGEPLLLPNAWDIGTARLFESAGFGAVATTSSGFAGTLGRLDGTVTLDEALAHSAELVGATSLPVTADSENLYADDLSDVADKARQFVDCGLAGFSIEDFTGDRDRGCYDAALAVERVRAAAEVAHAGDAHVVLTARAESFLYGGDDLDDVIARLQAYQEAGADVLYAPGLRTADQISSLVASVDAPVNVLALPGAPSVSELAELGVARISIGGAFYFAALGAVVSAATELKETGTYSYFANVGPGSAAANEAFAVRCAH